MQQYNAISILSSCYFLFLPSLAPPTLTNKHVSCPPLLFSSCRPHVAECTVSLSREEGTARCIDSGRAVRGAHTGRYRRPRTPSSADAAGQIPRGCLLSSRLFLFVLHRVSVPSFSLIALFNTLQRPLETFTVSASVSVSASISISVSLPSALSRSACSNGTRPESGTRTRHRARARLRARAGTGCCCCCLYSDTDSRFSFHH